MSEEYMPKGELIIDGRFEWWSEKNEANIINHGYSFKEIEAVFDDPYFYEMYDRKHSDESQTRYFGIASKLYRKRANTSHYGKRCDAERTGEIL